MGIERVNLDGIFEPKSVYDIDDASERAKHGECYVYVRTPENPDIYYRYLLSWTHLAEGEYAVDQVIIGPAKLKEMVQSGEASYNDFCTIFPFMLESNGGNHLQIIFSSAMVVKFINRLCQLFDVTESCVVKAIPQNVENKVYSRMCYRLNQQFSDVMRRFGFTSFVWLITPMKDITCTTGIKVWYCTNVTVQLAGFFLRVDIDLIPEIFLNSYEVGGCNLESIPYNHFTEYYYEGDKLQERYVSSLDEVRWNLGLHDD